MKKAIFDAPESEKIYFEQATDWETSRTQATEQSERRAWLVAAVAVGTAGFALAAICLMMPLKESVPYVIRVDNATGIPDIITTIKDKQVTGDDVMDKYWLAQYVRARETYDWYTLQHDYTMVGLLSSANIGKGYAQLFEGHDALDKQYGKTVRATVDILSVVPNGKNVGTVRFTKTMKRVDQETAPGSVTQWVATISYEYLNTAHIKESARLINPFGFQVLSYRIDPEMVGQPQ